MFLYTAMFGMFIVIVGVRHLDDLESLNVFRRAVTVALVSVDFLFGGRASAHIN